MVLRFEGDAAKPLTEGAFATTAAWRRVALLSTVAGAALAVSCSPGTTSAIAATIETDSDVRILVGVNTL